MSKKKSAKKPKLKVVQRKASAEEMARGVPANGHVVLFRLYTAAEHKALEKAKEIVARDLPEGIRPSWQNVILWAMSEYQSKGKAVAA